MYLKAGTGNLIARIPGEQVTVQLDLDKVTLFEPETEQIIRQTAHPDFPVRILQVYIEAFFVEGGLAHAA